MRTIRMLTVLLGSAWGGDVVAQEFPLSTPEDGAQGTRSSDLTEIVMRLRELAGTEREDVISVILGHDLATFAAEERRARAVPDTPGPDRAFVADIAADVLQREAMAAANATPAVPNATSASIPKETAVEGDREPGVKEAAPTTTAHDEQNQPASAWTERTIRGTPYPLSRHKGRIASVIRRLYELEHRAGEEAPFTDAERHAWIDEIGEILGELENIAVELESRIPPARR